MKRLLLLLIPLTVIILGGCTDNNIAQRVYDLENNQNLLFDNYDSIIGRLDNIEQSLLQTGMIENTTTTGICIGLTDISVSTYQAKDVFECIASGEGYCNCIENFASCGKMLSDIPKEYRYDFNPDCFDN